jgi:hypothetical protein
VIEVALLLWTFVTSRAGTAYHHNSNTTATISKAGTTYHHKSNTTSVKGRAGTTYHHKSNTTSSTSRAGTTNGRGRVTLVMATVPALLVTDVVLE